MKSPQHFATAATNPAFNPLLAAERSSKPDEFQLAAAGDNSRSAKFSAPGPIDRAFVTEAIIAACG